MVNDRFANAWTREIGNTCAEGEDSKFSSPDWFTWERCEALVDGPIFLGLVEFVR